MNANCRRHKNFELIQGGLQRETSYGPLRIVAAPESGPPFKVEALVIEEDTWLVMSAVPTVCEAEVHPIRLMTDVIEAVPEPVGSVLVKNGNPLRFLAVVHDVNQEPTWKETWIEKALSRVFLEAELYKLSSIGLPLLGTRHGSLEQDRFVFLLARVLKRTDFNHLGRLWLIVPAKTNSEIFTALDAELVNS
jgi:hypothetical protein